MRRALMADEHATDHTIRAAEDHSDAATLVGPTRPNEIDLPGRSVELPPRPIEDGPTGAPPGPGRPVTVLLVEDDPLDGALFTEHLALQGFEVTMRRSLEGVSADDVEACDVVLLDLGLPGVHGLDGLRLIRAMCPSCPVVVLTGDTTPGLAEEAIADGAQDYVDKQAAVAIGLDRAIRHALHRAAFASARHHQALHDPLTDLPNRTRLAECLDLLVGRAREHELLVGVLYLDLDGFKPINDRFGHDAGDRVLQVVADRLRDELRPSDTVSRIGGDEFVLLVSELDDVGAADRIAERIATSIARPIDDRVGTLRVTATIGIAVSNTASASTDLLLIQADRACIEAKWRREAIRRADAIGPADATGRARTTDAWETVVDTSGAVLGVRAALPSDVVGARPGDHAADLRDLVDAARLLDARELTAPLGWAAVADPDAVSMLCHVVGPDDPRIVFELATPTLDLWPEQTHGLGRLRAAGHRIALGGFRPHALGALAAIRPDLVRFDADVVTPLLDQPAGDEVLRELFSFCHRVGCEVAVGGIGDGLARRVVALGADRWHRAVDPAVAQIAGAHDVD